MLTWGDWVARVLAIASARGIIVTTDYPTPGYATFTWRCTNGSQYGVSSAGIPMIGLTTPEQFTMLWTCSSGAGKQQLEAAGQLSEGQFTFDRRGRFVPFVPARAVRLSMERLFS